MQSCLVEEKPDKGQGWRHVTSAFSVARWDGGVTLYHDGACRGLTTVSASLWFWQMLQLRVWVSVSNHQAASDGEPEIYLYSHLFGGTLILQIYRHAMEKGFISNYKGLLHWRISLFKTQMQCLLHKWLQSALTTALHSFKRSVI